jgi:hypothetical protein
VSRVNVRGQNLQARGDEPYRGRHRDIARTWSHLIRIGE